MLSLSFCFAANTRGTHTHVHAHVRAFTHTLHHHQSKPAADRWAKMDASPIYRNENKLREWQIDGVSWLLFNWYNNRGCILADEMGLGKTVQTVATLDHIHKNYTRVCSTCARVGVTHARMHTPSLLSHRDLSWSWHLFLPSRTGRESSRRGPTCKLWCIKALRRTGRPLESTSGGIETSRAGICKCCSAMQSNAAPRNACGQHIMADTGTHHAHIPARMQVREPPLQVRCADLYVRERDV